MRVFELKDPIKAFRVRLSRTEMAALRKIVDMGLIQLEQEEAQGTQPLTTSELKSIAYWRGKNPLTVIQPRRDRRRARPLTHVT